MEQVGFYSLSGEEQVVIAAALAFLMSEGLTSNQLNILGNFIEAIGQNILVIASQPGNNSPSPPPADSSAELAELKKELACLKAKIEGLTANTAQPNTR